MSESETGAEEQPSASFSERLVAFTLDSCFFYGFLTLARRIPAASGLPRSAWIALFLLYHAACVGFTGTTPGKWLLGLRVAGREDGRPLAWTGALLRSLGYLASSFFYLGFLRVLYDPEGLAWHDIIASSKVVSPRPHPAASVKAGAALCLAAWAGLFSWRVFGAPRYRRLEKIAYARVTLKGLAGLEEDHRSRFGAYTGSLEKLVGLAADAASYQRALERSLDVPKGLEISLAADGKSFTISSYARDPGRTRVLVNGPEVLQDAGGKWGVNSRIGWGTPEK